MPSQHLNEWSDIQKVNNAITIDVGFFLKLVSDKNRNEWVDVKEVQLAIAVDIPHDDTGTPFLAKIKKNRLLLNLTQGYFKILSDAFFGRFLANLNAAKALVTRRVTGFCKEFANKCCSGGSGV